MASEVVLDASALLAVIRAERGADAVFDVLGDAVMSSVNLAEVISRLVDLGAAPDAARAEAAAIAPVIAPFDEALAGRAGELRAVTRPFGLSLGDRACLALAERERLPVLTADRAWADLNLGVEVRLIR